MGYFIRVLTPSTKALTLTEVRGWLPPAFRLETEEPRIRTWSRLVLRHDNQQPVAQIERHPCAAVVGSTTAREGSYHSASLSVGEALLERFTSELAVCRPHSAVQWLQTFLPRVQTIYALRIEPAGVQTSEGWNALHRLYYGLHRVLGGILQADDEGFSNEDGCHILWQFPEQARGHWEMAVREGETWTSFVMDLANRQHRQAFLAGRVPPGVERLADPRPPR